MKDASDLHLAQASGGGGAEAEDVAEGGEELQKNSLAVESRFGKGRRLGRGGRWDEVFGETVDLLQDGVFIGGRVFRRVGRRRPVGCLPMYLRRILT